MLTSKLKIAARFSARWQFQCAAGAFCFMESLVKPNPKTFRFTRIPIFVITRPSRTPQEGRCASSRNVGRGMRWTLGRRPAVWPPGETLGWRTAKSCGPGAATVASIRPACAGLATVTTNAAHRGEHV
jgi:hypothetical protein